MIKYATRIKKILMLQVEYIFMMNFQSIQGVKDIMDGL